MFEVAVEHTFAAGHALRNYRGKCENVHGHNYRVRVLVRGEKLDQTGMLADFTELKRVLRAVSVIKKRTGFHESTIREYRISNEGLSVGEPLEAFQGVLRGVPEYAGDQTPLLPEKST